VAKRNDRQSSFRAYLSDHIDVIVNELVEPANVCCSGLAGIGTTMTTVVHSNHMETSVRQPFGDTPVSPNVLIDAMGNDDGRPGRLARPARANEGKAVRGSQSVVSRDVVHQ
jgi:hypothetical protein